jgi:hypothetical protein
VISNGSVSPAISSVSNIETDSGSSSSSNSAPMAGKCSYPSPCVSLNQRVNTNSPDDYSVASKSSQKLTPAIPVKTEPAPTFSYMESGESSDLPLMIVAVVSARYSNRTYIISFRSANPGFYIS